MQETFKKWTLLGVILICVFFAALVFFGPSLQNRKVAEKNLQEPSFSSLQSAGEANQVKVLTVEELKADVSDPRSLARLGDQYFEGNNFEQAIEIYNKVLELDPGDVDTYNDLGLAYFYTGNPALAEEVLTKGIEANPNFQRIWLSLGFVLKSSGKREEARAILQKALELGPDTEIGREARRMLVQP